MALRRYSGRRYRGWVHPDLETFPQLLEHPDELEKQPGTEALLLNEGRSIYRIRLQLGGRPGSFFAYYFKNGSLSRSLRRSYAFRSLRISRKLIRYGFGTVEIVVALKRRGEWLNWHSLLVAREIGPVLEVPSGGNHVYRIHPSAELDEGLLGALASELARLHGHGFFHGDLKTRHILVHRRGASASTFSFSFVDLEKCHHFPRAPALLRDLLAARDLIQFFASLGDGDDSSRRLRGPFLDRYLGAGALPARRRQRLLHLLKLYGPLGQFRQGEPVIYGVRRWWRKLGEGVEGRRGRGAKG